MIQTDGSVPILLFSNKDLLKLILPLIVEQLLAVTIGMVDTVMVSSVGEAAVSGVSLVDTVNILLVNIFSALATGGAVVVSQYLGRFDVENARVASKQLIYTVFAISAIFSIVVLVIRGWLLSAIFGETDPMVMQSAQTYFLYSALSYPFLAVYNAGAALFRSQGNSKISMYAALLMNVVHIVLNAIFIYGWSMGVRGAAISLFIARAVACFMMLELLRRPNNPLCVDDLLRFEYRGGMVANILRIGIPNGLENGVFQIGKILVQGLVASFGVVAMAANAVANNIASMQVIPGSAIGLALITVVGQCVGAGDYKQARHYVKKLMGIAYLSLAVLNILIILGMGPILSLYELTEETRYVAWQLMMCHGINCMVIWLPSFAMPNALRAAGDVTYTMIVSIVSMWVFRVGLSYLLGLWLGWGILGVWVAMVGDWAFRALCFFIRICGTKWQKKSIVAEG